MKPIKTIYISGLGAIGSSYAAILHDFNPRCIRIIADPARIERYRGQGILINDRNYPLQFAAPGERSVPADLIIIAVKQHHLTQCIQDIRPFVGPETIILSLLNGITSEAILGREFGMEKILYAFVVGTDAVREGTRTQYSRLGKIVFGEPRNETYSPKVKAVKDLFDRAGIPYLIPENMIREQWWKFMMNVGINQISAVLGADYGVFQTIPEARELLEAAYREVICLSEQTGINLNQDDIHRCNQIIDTLAPEGKTSMLQDVEAGRKTEVEIFAGTVVELGRKYGIATPVNEMLLRMIQTIEKMTIIK